jgi:hypothetical protein
MLHYLSVHTVLVISSLQTWHAAFAASVDWTQIKTERGDRLPDFSYCGYHASEKALPPVDTLPTVTLNPGSGDQTLNIQSALDKVYKNGGGIVALSEGSYEISVGLKLSKGTVLRGAGADKTKLSLKSLGTTAVFTMGDGASSVTPSTSSMITDDYVGIGASTLTLNSSNGFKAGQSVIVQRAVTTQWVRANGMSDLVRDGKHQTWLAVSMIKLKKKKKERKKERKCGGKFFITFDTDFQT